MSLRTCYAPYDPTLAGRGVVLIPEGRQVRSVVGGTPLAAAITLLRKQRRGLLLSAIAGFGMSIWAFTELAIMGEYSPLQAAYFHSAW